jgi:PAS domain S-box-containing protein
VHQIELKMRKDELRRAQAESEEARRKYQNLYEMVPAGCLTVDLRGTILDVNPAAATMIGQSPSTLIGRCFQMFVDEGDRSQFYALCNAILKGEGRKTCELRLPQGNQKPTTVLISGPLAERLGRTAHTLPLAMTDISQLKQAEAARRETEELARAFLENSATVAWMKDTEGRYVYFSQSFERRFGTQCGEWLGKTDFELWPRELAETYRANDLRVLKTNCVLEEVEEAQNLDGTRSWWLSHKFPFIDTSGNLHVGGLAVEITDRKRTEKQLQQSQEQLSQHRAKLEGLASKLIAAQERERQRLARELHDDFSQRLAALVLDLASLEQQPPVLPELIPKSLEPVRVELEQLADDVHNLAYTLHPSLLVHAGLQPAIEDHIHQVTNRTGLPIHIDARNVPSSLSLDQATCLFRILQESLRNIVKHANAAEVMVRLSGSSKGVGLSVMDDGKGFDAEEKSGGQKGLGLISMHERLRLLNGFFRVHSRATGGTKVCAWIPLKEGKYDTSSHLNGG